MSVSKGPSASEEAGDPVAARRRTRTSPRAALSQSLGETNRFPAPVPRSAPPISSAGYGEYASWNLALWLETGQGPNGRRRRPRRGRGEELRQTAFPRGQFFWHSPDRCLSGFAK